MDPCNHPIKCNCLKNCSCPSGYDCCSESNNPANAKPTYGHCVREGTCDSKRGICKSKRVSFNPTLVEIIPVQTIEGYDEEKSNGLIIFLVGFGILLVFITIYLIINRK